MAQKRKVWYLYKNGFDFGMRVSQPDALTALEQEAKRTHSRNGFGDIIENERIVLQPLCPEDDTLIAQLEDLK